MTNSAVSSQSFSAASQQYINQAIAIKPTIEPCSHFAMLPATVFHANSISDKAKLVYAHLVSLSGENKNFVWVRQATLGNILNCTASTIARAIKQLLKEGLIKATRHYHQGRYKIYQIVWLIKKAIKKTFAKVSNCASSSVEKLAEQNLPAAANIEIKPEKRPKSEAPVKRKKQANLEGLKVQRQLKLAYKLSASKKKKL